MHVITYMYNKIHKQSVIFRCFRLILVASQKHHIGYFLACAYVPAYPPSLLPHPRGFFVHFWLNYKSLPFFWNAFRPLMVVASWS